MNGTDMAAPYHTAPYRLLAVENDLDCSDLIVRTARGVGYAGLAVADHQSMDEAIRNWRPHVITLDLCLPEIDGMQVISSVKATGFAGDLIIISAEDEWIRDLTGSIATESGLSVPAHMGKPVDFYRLQELLTGSAGKAGHRGRAVTKRQDLIPALAAY
jgi:CheY-like chemotaxis protein